MDRPELRFKANDLLVNCSTHFDNDQLEAILDVFDQIIALFDIEEKDMPLLSDEKIRSIWRENTFMSPPPYMREAVKAQRHLDYLNKRNKEE